MREQLPLQYFKGVICFSVVVLGALYWNMLDNGVYRKTHGQRIPFNSREAMDDNFPPVLHFAAVTYGYSYVQHTLNIMKTILLLTKSNIQWYVFTTDKSAYLLAQEIEKWPEEYKERINVIEAPMMCDQWLNYTGKQSLRHLRGMAIKPCVFCSFDKTIIKNYTDKFIYLDLDILPVDDLSRAWGIFSTFSEDHIMGMARADIRYIKKNFSVYDSRYGLNTGVIFVNVKQMAGVDFESKYVECAQETFRYDNIRGVGPNDDQDIMNVYFYKHPYQVSPVGCNWNYRKSMEKCKPGDVYNCDEAKPLGVSIIHATAHGIFEKGHFNPLYNCSFNIDLENIKDTITCFQDGIDYFYSHGRRCDQNAYYLRPLQTILQKRYTEYYRTVD